MAKVKSLSNTQWEAQHDAQTLMEADEILKDKTRTTKAKGAAKTLAKEKKADLVSLQKVIKQKPIKQYERKGLKVPNKRYTKLKHNKKR